MPQRPNTLLLPGSAPSWTAIAAAERRAHAVPTTSIEDRLRRGQQLSSGAAALRRAVSGGTDSRS